MVGAPVRPQRKACVKESEPHAPSSAFLPSQPSRRTLGEVARLLGPGPSSWARLVVEEGARSLRVPAGRHNLPRHDRRSLQSRLTNETAHGEPQTCGRPGNLSTLTLGKPNRNH
jgi:hypothetical protein